MKKKKRYRIRWGRVAILLTALAAVIAAIYYAIVGIIALVGWLTSSSLFTEGKEEKVDNEVFTVSPQQLRESQLMTERIDSIMHQPMRLDTTLIAISIFDLTTRQHIYSMHDQAPLPPASCMKVPTAIAAIKLLGMDHEYAVSLLTRGKMKGDTLVGNLMLNADDDPLFESFDGLIGRLRQKGIRAVRGNIYYNLVREDTLRPHPTAKTWDIAYHRTPLLLKGEKFVKRTFQYSLAAHGIAFVRDTSVKPEGRYSYVATEKHSMRDVITPMIIHSSNIKAEALFYHLDYKHRLASDHHIHWITPHAVEQFLQNTFRSDSAMVIDGVPVSNSTRTMQGFVLNDGSGLSPDNRLSASFLVDILRYAYADKQLRDYLINEALATPGDAERSGSLKTRMQQPDYRGRIFVKTGTLTTIGGSSLSGYLQGSDGHWYVFSIINTDSPVAESRIFQDRLCRMMMGKTVRK